MWATRKYESTVHVVLTLWVDILQWGTRYIITPAGAETCAEETPGWLQLILGCIITQCSCSCGINHKISSTNLPPTAGSRPIIVTNGGSLSSSVLYLAEMWWPGRIVGAPDSLVSELLQMKPEGHCDCISQGLAQWLLTRSELCVWCSPEHPCWWQSSS